jgi:hypothetical protein
VLIAWRPAKIIQGDRGYTVWVCGKRPYNT